MKAYILNWNPKEYNWKAGGLDREIRRISEKGFAEIRWSCGNSKNIPIGTRIFLLRQRVEPKGIVASGYTKSLPELDKKWNDRKKRTMYVQVKFDRILDVEQNDILQLKYLKKIPFHWGTQKAASISEEICAQIEQYWQEISGSSEIFPNEIIDDKKIPEGSLTRVTVNTYERNPEARRRCLEYHGYKCKVCDFDFAETYGDHGKAFTHVHHLKPLNTIRQSYLIDPIKDLVPVCPNCHAMIHRGKKALSIAELKKILRSRGR